MLEGLGPAPEEGDERPQPSGGSFDDQVLPHHPVLPQHSCGSGLVQVTILVWFSGHALSWVWSNGLSP